MKELKIVSILLFLWASNLFGQEYSSVMGFEYYQCENEQVIFVDSLGNEIDSVQANLIFIFNNGKDTIKLEQLYDADLTHNIEPPYGFEKVQIDLMLGDSTNVDTTRYCISCTKEDVKIIDSIDINKDGVKELFLFREWYCSASPPNPGQYGVGIQGQTYSQYEVWDIKLKKKVIEVKNRYEMSMAVSTNVMTSCGYTFAVNIDKKGSFYLSNLSKIGIESQIEIYEMGKYKYDNISGKYKKEKK